MCQLLGSSVRSSVKEKRGNTDGWKSMLASMLEMHLPKKKVYE